MQPRSKRSEPPAPQARASGPLHASREWASGRFRALRDRTQVLAEKTIRLSQPYIAALERANPPPGAPRSNWRERTHSPSPKFSCLNLLLVVTPNAHRTQARGSSSGPPVPFCQNRLR